MIARPAIGSARHTAGPAVRRRLLAAVGTTALGTALGAFVPARAGARSEMPATGAAPSANARPKPEVPLPARGSSFVLPSLPLLDGSTLTAEDRRGKATIVYWWASWCPFCAEQSPLMETLWRTHRDRGLVVVGVSIDRTAEIAAAHWRRKGYTFPTAWLSPQLMPVLGKPKGLPVTIAVGTDDRVVAAESGQMFEEDVAALGSYAPRP